MTKSSIATTSASWTTAGWWATYAIRTLDDVMRRGVLLSPFDLEVLAAFATTFFLARVILFKRELRAR